MDRGSDMPTAKGKVTAARVQPGNDIKLTRSVGGGWTPSPTKVKAAVTARVISVRPVKVGRSTGRRISALIGTDVVHLDVGASQTFWRS